MKLTKSNLKPGMLLCHKRTNVVYTVVHCGDNEFLICDQRSNVVTSRSWVSLYTRYNYVYRDYDFYKDILNMEIT